MFKKTAAVVVTCVSAIGLAQAAVDLDRVCMLNGLGFEAGDVVLAPQGKESPGGSGIVCSMVAGQAGWLPLAEQSVEVVKQKESAQATTAK